MSWSNIFLQLITPTGPVIGEGLLEGFQTAIELQGLKGAITGNTEPEKEKAVTWGGALSSLAGLAVAAELNKKFGVATDGLGVHGGAH